MIRLSELHEQRVNVELPIAGKSLLLSGAGCYCNDPTLGYVLRIRFSEDAGGTELLLEERSWTGEITRPAEDQPYLIKLDAASRSPAHGT